MRLATHQTMRRAHSREHLKSFLSRCTTTQMTLSKDRPCYNVVSVAWEQRTGVLPGSHGRTRRPRRLPRRWAVTRKPGRGCRSCRGPAWTPRRRASASAARDGMHLGPPVASREQHMRRPACGPLVGGGMRAFSDGITRSILHAVGASARSTWARETPKAQQQQQWQERGEAVGTRVGDEPVAAHSAVRPGS